MKAEQQIQIVTEALAAATLEANSILIAYHVTEPIKLPTEAYKLWLKKQAIATAHESYLETLKSRFAK